MVVLFVDSSHNIEYREPPLIVFLVPNSTNLIVLIKAYGNLSGYMSSLFIFSFKVFLQCFSSSFLYFGFLHVSLSVFFTNTLSYRF